MSTHQIRAKLAYVRDFVRSFWKFVRIEFDVEKQKVYRQEVVAEFAELIAEQLQDRERLDLEGQIIFTLYSMATLSQMHNRGQFDWGLIKGRDIGLTLQEQGLFPPAYFEKLLFVYPIVERCVRYEADTETGKDLQATASVDKLRQHPAIKAWLSCAAEPEV